MYIRNGIAYAGEEKAPLKVCGIRAMEDYRLWVRFNTGEAKVFDFSTQLAAPAFAPLRDKAIFDSVYIDYGIPVWDDGNIDIAPEYLYAHGVAAEKTANSNDSWGTITETYPDETDLKMIREIHDDPDCHVFEE